MKYFKLLSEKDVESGLFSSLPVHSYKGAESPHAHSDRWVHFHHSNLKHPAHIPDAVCVLHTIFLVVPRLCGFFFFLLPLLERAVWRFFNYMYSLK